MPKPNELALTQIAVSTKGLLYGLDADGKVWKYVPAVEDKHFAFWTRLTAFWKD